MPKFNSPHGRRYEMISVEWHRARMQLALPTGFYFCEICADGMEVDEARNYAVKTCLEMNPPPEFLFFNDFDTILPYDAVTKLFYRARCFPDHDIFAGVYCSKSSPPEPLIYHEWGQGPYWDWTVGDLLYGDRIVGVHSGLTLIRTSLFEKMTEPWYKTTHDEKKLTSSGIETRRGTEDLYFAEKSAREANAKILIDTSVLASHIDHKTGIKYGLPTDSPPVQRAKWLRFNKDKEEPTELKKALDLGAGETRREWPGYKTFTVDIRDDVGADYVMDMRLLNLPDEEFSLVASSHTLEHAPRFDQEKVWSEMARVLKPGGEMEHVVPDLQWAGEHLSNGSIDENVFNVLYGAQETHGYSREFNTHYFGYTKDIAQALCESVGLEVLELKNWKDDESLGYNLIIRAKKPGLKDDPKLEDSGGG